MEVSGSSVHRRARPGDVRGTRGDQGVRTGKEVLERSNTWPKVVLAQVFQHRSNVGTLALHVCIHQDALLTSSVIDCTGCHACAYNPY